MIDKTLFGNYIAKRRKELGLTQSGLAEKLNISFQAISKWERGVSIPDRDTLMNLAEVLKIQGSWFAFESASSFSLKELVSDVNENGITGKNYLSIGAMLMSEGFSHKTIREFDNQKIRDSLAYLLDSRTEWDKMSLLALSHHFCKEYASRLDDSFITSQIYDIYGINVCAFESAVEYPYIIMRRIMSLVAEQHAPCALLITNECSETSQIQIQMVCSSDLVQKGFNCSYLSSCLGPAIFRVNMVAGASGGGNQDHASLIVHPQEREALRDDNFQRAISLFLNYVQVFDKAFDIVLVQQESAQ